MNHTKNTAVATTLEAAEILAKAIQATPEWKEFQDARVAFEHDAELQELVSRYRRLVQSWQAARQRGQGLTGNEAMQLSRLQSQIEDHPVYQREREAGSALVALLQMVNQNLSAELGLDFAANAAPRGGGCCG